MLATIGTFFLFGTAWFWIALGVMWVIVTFAAENDRGVAATITLVAMSGLFLSGNHDWLRSIMVHPWQTLAFIIGYFIAGAVWGVIKWYVFVRNRTECIREAQENYLREHSLDRASMTADQQKRMWSNVASAVYSSLAGPDRDPRREAVAADNKTRILTWMTYWPWSLVWTLINDPVRHVFRRIYYRISTLLQHIADKAAASVKLPEAIPETQVPESDEDEPMFQRPKEWDR